jgi:hypothetical protein
VNEALLDDTQKNLSGKFTFNGNVGLLYKINQEMGIGLVGANLIPLNIAASSDSGAKDQVSPLVKLGFGYTKPKFNAMIDAEYLIIDRVFNFKLGGEIFLLNKKFRAGLGAELMNLQQFKPSIGFGYDLGMIVIDYAMSYPIELGTAGDHMFSVTAKF